MDPFKNVLEYIRNFFNPTLERSRKRKAPNLEVVSPKISRYSPYNTVAKTRIIPIQRETDDSEHWFARKPETCKKSPQQKYLRTPMKQLWVEDPVVLDDDDFIEIKKPPLKMEDKAGFKGYTSTPTDNTRKHFNGNGCENDDDVVLVKTFKSPKDKINTSRSKTTPKDKLLFNIGANTPQNGSKSKEKNRQNNFRSSLNGSRGRGILDYSFRLEDKQQYKKLLEQASNSPQNSSMYHTPLGSIFSSFDIGNSSSKKSKSPYFSLDKSHDKPTVKETIMKVIESDPVIVKDSDSEDSVIVVNPPSPKPDIKVEPVNSLKKIVDTSKVARKDWLDEIVERHKQFVDQRQREINDIRQCSEKTGEINKDINIELLRRKVNDCLQLRDVILPEIVTEPDTALPQLTDEHERMVQRAFRGNPNEVLAKKFNLNITRRDLMTLAGLNWLNDEVINFYMNLIIERGKESKWPKSYAFNTFFYTKLLKDGPQSLRRWTKRVDIFEHDLICIPIHLGMHWCMAIIDFREKSIRYYDSMGSPNNRCLEALRNYLEAEHMDKKGSKYDTCDFVLENMDNIPQQMNGSDCGMFACTFAEFITRNAKITFKQEDMPYFRKKMVVEIMLGDLMIK